MKTSEISSKPSNTAPGAAPKTEKDQNRKTFSKVLEGRRGKDKSTRKSDEFPGEERELPLNSRENSALPVSSLTQAGESESKVTSAQPVSPKQSIQALVQEISHSVNARGLEQVDIQLNSKVFDGLKIQIVRQPGAFDIRFESASDVVAQLLARNVGALSQSLAAQGVPVGQIRVNEVEPARWTSRNPQGRSKGGGQGRQRHT